MPGPYDHFGGAKNGLAHMIGLVVAAILGWFGANRYVALAGFAYACLFYWVYAASLANAATGTIVVLLFVPLAEFAIGYLMGACGRRYWTGIWPWVAARNLERRRQEEEADHIHKNLALDGEAPIAWTADIPLITNPVILRVFALVCAIAFVAVTVIFWAVSPRGGWIDAVIIATIGVGAVLVLVVFVCVVLLGNRLTVRYLVSPQGYISTVADGQLAWTNAAAMTGGSVSGNATMTGSALLAQSSRSQIRSWSLVKGIKLDPRRYRIVIILGVFNDILYCTPAVYPLVAGRLQEVVKPNTSGKKKFSD